MALAAAMQSAHDAAPTQVDPLSHDCASTARGDPPSHDCASTARDNIADDKPIDGTPAEEGQPVPLERLRGNPFFAQFDASALEMLAPHCRRHAIAPGAGFVAAGAVGSAVFVIDSGRAAVVVPVEGSRQEVAALGPGDLVGELALIRGGVHIASVVATTAVEAFRIPSDAFRAAVEADRRWPSPLLSLLAERVHITNKPLALLSYAAEQLLSDRLDPDLLARLGEEACEIGHFAALFQDMARYVTERTERLEAAVAARTQALSAEIARRERLEAELKRLATTDSLTGIANRRHFLEAAESELARARRYRRPLMLMLLDIDRFKVINDSYGHAAGDTVLCALVRCCQHNLRAQDILGRIGGEEFAILVPECPAAVGMTLAERLRRGLAATSVENAQGPLRFTVSIGLTDCAGDAPLAAYIERADKALYKAKMDGRNRVVCADGD